MFSVIKISDTIDSIGIDGIMVSNLITHSDLSLQKGKRYGMCGKNGCGKTTILKGLSSITQNSIYIDQYISSDTWKEVNIVDAILNSNAERVETLKKLELGEDAYAVDIDSDEAEVKKILHGLGFNHGDFTKTYYEFSGGWKTRVSLARALFMKPRVLLLDEPTNHLDMEAVYWLESYLQKFSGILIFTSHNISFLNNTSTDIINISQKKMKQFRGNYYKFRKQLESDNKNLEKEWDKLQRELKGLRSKGKIKEAQELEKKKSLDRPEKPYKITMDFQTDKKIKSPYLVMDNVSFGYNDATIIENTDFTLSENTRVTIIGPNGCGKSTFIKLIVGNIQPVSGKIVRSDHVKVSYFTQHSIEELPGELTPVEFIQQKYPSLSVEEIRQVLGQISLDSKHHVKQIKYLSGGQRMRIVFSEVILDRPHVLLLDEPTNHLDVETIESLIEAINNYTGSVIIISHDVNLIEETNCLVYCLSDKKLEETTIDSYLEKISDLYT